MLYRLFAVALTAQLFAGCASVPMESKENDKQLKAFAPPAEGKAGIYIYRPNLWDLSKFVGKDIWINGLCLGAQSIMYFSIYKCLAISNMSFPLKHSATLLI